MRRFGFVSNITTSDEQKMYMKSFKLATLQKRGLDKVLETYKENIDTTSAIIKYCKNNGIKFYRMGDLFPFSTHPDLGNFDHINHFTDDLYELGQLAKFTKTRLSIHSSMYCKLNSANIETVKKSALELNNHAKLMNAMELAPDNRTVVHVGSSGGGKPEAKRRFIHNFKVLPEWVQKRIVLENDDKTFSYQDVEDIHKETGVPIVLDIFHLRCHNPEGIGEIEALRRACETWNEGEKPEIHFSSQDPEKAKGSHSAMLNVEELSSFLNKAVDLSFDVMLEVKDTHLSAERATRELSED